MTTRRPQERCKRDHDDWRYDEKQGTRYCHTCRLDRNRSYKRKSPDPDYKRPRRPGRGPEKLPVWSDASKNTGDKGGRLDTFSRSEILQARGML